MPRGGWRVLLGALAGAAGCGGRCDTLWFRDFDGDGAGDPRRSERACEAPAGFVAVAGDCDDRTSDLGPDVFDVCNGIDDDCDGEIDPEPSRFYADADADGYGTTELVFEGCERPPGFVTLAGDCDDADRDAHPGGVEVCNGQDDDCDGLTDDGADGDEIWFRDRDGDGYGGEWREACGRPAAYGWTLLAGDCDDGNPTRNPGRTEVCDGIDNDCDGATDDDDGSLEGGAQAWVDADGDGYGGEPATRFGPYGPLAVRVCTFSGSPYVDLGGDCDDGDGAVHPDAGEACGGTDEDCDGLLDEADPPVTGTVSAYADGDADGHRGPFAADRCVVGAGELPVDAPVDCDDADPLTGPDLWIEDGDGDGFGAGSPVPGVACRPRSVGQVNVLRADCDDTGVSIHPGALDLCGDGVDGDCSGFDPVCSGYWTGGRAISEARATIPIAAVSVSAADLDGDHIPDLALGASGTASVVFGPLPEVYGEPEPDLGIADSLWGSAFAAPGRLVLGGPTGWLTAYVVGPDRALSPLGNVLLLGGSVSQLRSSTLPPDASGLPPLLAVGGTTIERISFDGYVSDAELGTPVPPVVAPAGDMDGDGEPDLAIGLPSRSTVHVVGQGEAWNGAPLAVFSTWSRVSTAGTGAGTALATLDWDGDGLDDVAAGAPLDGTLAAQAGALVVSSPIGGDLLTVFGTGAGDLLGAALAAVDLDGDGLDDLVVGVPGGDGGGAGGGEVLGYLAGRLGTLDRSDADLVWTGATGEGLGAGLLAADLDGDLRDDLAIGGATSVLVLIGAPGP